jgi:hypothetical protein
LKKFHTPLGAKLGNVSVRWRRIVDIERAAEIAAHRG